MTGLQPKLRGRVVRVTLRRLKDGSITHATRVEFDDDIWIAVTIRGELPQTDLRRRLLDALNSRYEILGDLPEPQWHRASASMVIEETNGSCQQDPDYVCTGWCSECEVNQ